MNHWHLDTLVVRFTIDCNPLPKERPRVTSRVNKWTGESKTFAYTPKRTKQYEAYVALLARQAMGDREPEKGLLCVSLVFYRARRNADIDNCTKSVMDAIQGVVFNNDNQVVDLHAQWFRDKENPRALVEVWRVRATE